MKSLAHVVAVGFAGFALVASPGCSSCDQQPVAAAPQPTVEAVPASKPVQDDRPNVLIVLWDTVRADRMSLYGHTRATTPKLDAFAKEALVFERALSPGMWTLPSHASVFTGLPPTTVGAHARYRWVDGHHQTLAEIFGAEGYGTYAFSSNLIASPLTNLFQGFQEQHLTYKGKHTRRARELTSAKLISRDASTEISPSFRSEDPDSGWERAVFKDAAPMLSEHFLGWLDGRDEGVPFFAYLNMMEAHTPRVPSLASRQALLSPEQLELGLATDQSLFAACAWVVGEREYTDDELEALGGVYDSAILDLDGATDVLFRGMAERGMLDNTIVVLMADHGEGLGGNRMLEHRYSVYDALLRVPLVVRYPAKVKPGRVSAPVSTTDVFATLTELVGVEVPPDPRRQSSNLLDAERPPLVASVMLDPFESSLREIKQAFPELDLSKWLRTYTALTDGTHKLIRASDGSAELYKIDDDPHETTDLHGVEEEVLAELLAKLETWEAAVAAYDPTMRSATDKGAQKPHDAATRQQLEALGYLEEEAPARPAPRRGAKQKGKRGRPR
jgi:arylsulfatase A-like enzyme